MPQSAPLQGSVPSKQLRSNSASQTREGIVSLHRPITQAHPFRKSHWRAARYGRPADLFAIFFRFQNSHCLLRARAPFETNSPEISGDIPLKMLNRPTTVQPSLVCTAVVGSELNSTRIPAAAAVSPTRFE